MKKFAKTAFLFLLTFVTVFSSILVKPLQSVQAQCPPNAEEPYCSGSPPGDPPGARYTCSVFGGLITNTVFDGNISLCEAVVYQIARVAFSTPPPQPWYDPDPRQFARLVFDDSNPDEIFGERYTYAQVKWIFNSFVVMLFPPLRANDVLELFQMISEIIDAINEAGETVNSFGTASIIPSVLPKYGFIGQTYSVMAQIPGWIFTDKIASGVDEVKFMASKLDIASPAYAQGLGYEKLGMGTVRGLWIATRNVAYLIGVVLLVVAGFMTIFRTKISAQASVNIQMVIPRLVLSLILVTFSFAIVGFVIDMIYVVIVAVLGFISFAQGVTGFTMINDLNAAVTDMTGPFSFVGRFLLWYIVVAIILLIVTIVLTIAAAWVTIGAASVVAPLLGIIMGFFMWSVYLWARIIGQLIVAYLSLILLTIAGPIMIIMDILPTSTGGFKKWIMCIIGNASVFVSYAVLSIFISLLFDNVTLAGFENVPGGPHIRSGFDLPIFQNGYPRNFFLQYLIYVGFMSMVPNIVSSIKNMFCKSDDPSNFIENTVKDTIGQFTSAGQKAGESINKALDDRYTSLGGQGARPKRTLGSGGASNPTPGGADT